MIASEIIMFSIQAGVRLYGAGRRAYVADTRQRGLILPMVTGPELNGRDAVKWYTGDGRAFLVDPVREWLRDLVDEARPRTSFDDNDGRRIELALLDQYASDFAHANPGGFQAQDDQPATTILSNRELAAVFRVRQWAASEAQTSPLRIVAGSLITVAVDYFITVPGAVSLKHPQGRALYAFLQGIDDVDFVDTPMGDIAGSVLVGVLETVAEHPALITGGEKELLLVKSVAQSMAESTARHLADQPLTVQQETATWLQLTARAVLKGGADAVLGNPEMFLRLDDTERTNVVVEVGNAISDLVIGPDRVNVQALFSTKGAETIVRASLSAIAKNPGVLRTGNEGVTNIIKVVADELSTRTKLVHEDTGPELIRLILDASADNMELLWPGDFKDGQKHLLVIANSKLLRKLAMPPPAGTWQPRLTQQQLLAVAETVFAEAVDNRFWLQAVPGEHTVVLDAVIDAVLASLRPRSGDMLSADSFVAAMQASVTAVATRQSLLNELPTPAGGPAKRALTQAIDAIFTAIFKPEIDDHQKWKLARQSAITTLIETSLANLATIGAEEKHINTLRTTMSDLADDKIELEDFAERLAGELRNV